MIVECGLCIFFSYSEIIIIIKNFLSVIKMLCFKWCCYKWFVVNLLCSFVLNEIKIWKKFSIVVEDEWDLFNVV